MYMYISFIHVYVYTHMDTHTQLRDEIKIM